MKTTQMEKIEKAMKKLDNALADLRKLYNEPETSLCEMAKISDYARLLNYTDFERTITD